jgi:hypothetical protein
LVHAVELVTPGWDGVNERFGAPFQRIAHSGFATPWVVGGTGDWAEDYGVDCSGLTLKAATEDGSGVYVIFTAVEVAEKRGRHWVRLPWCSRMRIQEVVEVGNADIELEGEGSVKTEPLGDGQSDGWVSGIGRTEAGCSEKVDRRGVTALFEDIMRGALMRAGP